MKTNVIYDRTTFIDDVTTGNDNVPYVKIENHSCFTYFVTLCYDIHNNYCELLVVFIPKI